MKKRTASVVRKKRGTHIDIVLTQGIALPRGWSKRLQNAVAMTWQHLPEPRWPMTATLLLTNNAAIRKLNRDFRGLDRPTNVLSFPQLTRQELAKLKLQNEPVALGDIAIAYPYVVDEAKRNNKILINYATHLIIHGFLHLLGYDHQSSRDAVRMERLETRIMAALDLPDPYCVAAVTRSAGTGPTKKRQVKRKAAVKSKL